MKELLYIPTGKYFRFFDEETNAGIVWSIEEYCNWCRQKQQVITINELIREIIIKKTFNSKLYKNVEIDKSSKLLESEFELIEV